MNRSDGSDSYSCIVLLVGLYQANNMTPQLIPDFIRMCHTGLLSSFLASTSSDFPCKTGNTPPFEHSSPMELNALQRAFKDFKRHATRDSTEKGRRIVILEKIVRKLMVQVQNMERQAALETRPGLLSSTTIISPILTSTAINTPLTGPSTGSPLPDDTRTSDSSSNARLRTEQQLSALLGLDPRANVPAADLQTPSSGLGLSFQNDSWATLNLISIEGDLDLDAILTELRKLAIDRVKQWRPQRSDIVPKKAKIIKWILKPDNIHKFKTFKTPFSTARASVWKGLVDELFPKSNDRGELIKYFGNTSKRPQFFGNFVEEVVRVHGRHCTQCPPQ